jgi:hypothetical protein
MEGFLRRAQSGMGTNYPAQRACIDIFTLAQTLAQTTFQLSLVQ